MFMKKVTKDTFIFFKPNLKTFLKRALQFQATHERLTGQYAMCGQWLLHPRCITVNDMAAFTTLRLV